MAHEVNLQQITGGACRRLPSPCPHTICRFSERVRQIQVGALAQVWPHLGGNKGGDRVSTVGMHRRPRIAV